MTMRAGSTQFRHMQRKHYVFTKGLTNVSIRFLDWFFCRDCPTVGKAPVLMTKLVSSDAKFKAMLNFIVRQIVSETLPARGWEGLRESTEGQVHIPVVLLHHVLFIVFDEMVDPFVYDIIR